MRDLTGHAIPAEAQEGDGDEVDGQGEHPDQAGNGQGGLPCEPAARDAQRENQFRT